MTNIIPKARPEITKDEAQAFIPKPLAEKNMVILLGRRSYYRDTMGEKGVNDRGIYDDAIMIISPTYFKTFNANCDPSIGRKGIAVLQDGVWQYRLGTHGLSKPIERQYRALVQADEVTVHRDGLGNDTGWFGINIHRGDYNTTSSEGCQTIYPDQWAEFIAAVQEQLDMYQQIRLPYVLTERADV